MGTGNVAVYCRVDSGGHPEMRQMVLAAQQHRLEFYAKEKGLQIAGYYTDNGYSGQNISRPAFERLMEDYKNGAFGTVLVVNFCRLYRGNRQNEPRWPFQICSINPLEKG
ncbi:MAG: recombinase family protein [Oscillospiraceae bacterium]